jgi:hypothetical protein
VANHHFGKLADVWKHLVLDEVLVHERPRRYAETHAGSAAYEMVGDHERTFGVLGFLDRATDLTGSAFHRVASDYVAGDPPLFPGSALQAMTLLGADASCLLCDLDPTSVGDLRSWSRRLGRTGCTVVEEDGMTAVARWLEDGGDAFVHVDPFDPWAAESGRSAVELAADVAEAGHGLAYWYGYSAPAERCWALHEIAGRTVTQLWCGDVMVTGRDGSVSDDGDLGVATTSGTGCGVVLANVSPEVVARCADLGRALVAQYDGCPLPGGEPGRLDLVLADSV